MNTLRRFADTVRFCARFDSRLCCMDWPHPHHSWRCIDTLNVLFCARMQTDSLNVFRRVFLVTFCAREEHAEAKGAVSPCKTCVRRSHATLFPDKTMSWQLGEGKKRWELLFHQPCGRVRIVSLVCWEMMSLTPHILSGWLLRPLLVSVNISVLGVVCFQFREAIFSQHVFGGLFCGSDARVRHGCDGFVAC